MKSLLYPLSIIFIVCAMILMFRGHESDSISFIFLSVISYGIAYFGEKLDKIIEKLEK